MYGHILTSESSDSPALWKLCSSVGFRNSSKNKATWQESFKILQEPLGGEPQSVLISGGCLKHGQSSISLLINRPWCQVSCKSYLFQIPSRVFSHLIQYLRYALETQFGKTGNAPGQLSRWATTTEPECPRACDVHEEKHRIEKPVHCNYRGAPAR